MLEIKNLSKIYKTKNNTVKALDNIHLKIQEKGMVFILGKSGSGKSTLLNVLGGLDQFDEGEIIICGKSSQDFKQSDFDSYRNTFIGFIFQEYNVMDNFTVKENIALALQLQGKKADEKVIQDILEEVDLKGLANRKPNELSGGQLQRVAIARALIKNPEIIMADEPTGALDSRTGKQVFDTLKKLSKEKLVLIVSHDKEFAKCYADRIIELADGQIISDTSKEYIEPTKMSDGISLIEDEFINISNTYQLTDKDIHQIIEKIKQHKGETIISFNENTNKEIKKTNHIDENGQLEVFHSTEDKHLHIKDYTKQKVSFIKSKLPFQSSFKLALSNLKLKPFRLFMTIMLSVVSFTLFGLTNTFSQYNKEIATFNSMKDSQIDYLSIGKTYMRHNINYTFEGDMSLNTDDYKKLNKKYPDILFMNTFASTNHGTRFEVTDSIDKVDKLPSDSSTPFYATSFSSLSTINDDIIKQNKFQLIGTLPQNDNEIVITEFMADTFKEFGYQTTNKKGKTTKYTISHSKDLIGKTIEITINSQIHKFKISGIIDTHINLERYEPLKQNQNEGLSNYYLSAELYTLLSHSYHKMGFITPKLLNESINRYQVYSTQSKDNFMDISWEDNNYTPDSFYHFNDINKKDIIDFQNNGSFFVNYNTIKLMPLNKNTTLEDYILQNVTDPTNEKLMKKAIQSAVMKYKDQLLKLDLKLSYYNSNEMDENIIDQLAGVYISDIENQSHSFVLKDKLIQKYHFEKDGYADSFIAPMCEEETLKDIITYAYDSHEDAPYEDNATIHYSLKNQVMPMFSSINSIIETLHSVFFYVGIGFAIFASVMFCNFIATSIANKKREIGILRAVGARGVDVLKIFFNESFVIATINWILSVILGFFSISFINSYIRNEFGILVTILDFGIIQILLLFIISISVAFIASALPVYQISRKKPIDAIKNKK